MIFKNVKTPIFAVSLILLADDANAIMDGFLSGFSSFNNVAQGVNDFVKSDTGQAIFKVVDSAGKLAKNSVDERKKEKEIAQRRSEYFKETDYYVNKEGTLCVFRNGEIMPLGGKKMNLSTLLENNIYVLNNRRFIYTTKDAIDPTVGHFKPVVFEEGKFYYVNGRLYQFVNKALQLYDVAMDDVNVEALTPEVPNGQSQLVNTVMSSLPIASTNANKTSNAANLVAPQPAEQTLPIQNEQATNRLKKIETVLNNKIGYVAKTGILNLGIININSINDIEYKLIINKIASLKKSNPTLLKSVIVFVASANNETAKYYLAIKSFCNKNGIRLRDISRKKIQNYIYRKFNTVTNNIDLTACDISDLTGNEVLFLRCCAIEFLTKYFGNKSTPKKKILLNIKAVKNSNIRKTNLKIIRDLANTYKKFMAAKVVTSNGVTLL